MPDELDPVIESVYIVDGSKRVTRPILRIISKTLQKVATSLAGKSPTIKQAIIKSTKAPHVVLEMTERILDQVGVLSKEKFCNLLLPERFLSETIQFTPWQ